MSQLKAKQIKLVNTGDLIVGGVNGNGSILSAGGQGKVLRVNSGTLNWEDVEKILSANGLNFVEAADGTGVSINVQNGAADAAVKLAQFLAGSASDESFVFSSAAGSIEIKAAGTATDVNVVITPQGNGEVIIGGNGESTIQGEDGQDLHVLGGAGAGNLVIDGGGTGKAYYGSVAPANEIATIADTHVQGRQVFTGTDTFALPATVNVCTIVASINGLIIEPTLWNFDGTNVTFGELGYDLDGLDTVIFTYDRAVN